MMFLSFILAKTFRESLCDLIRLIGPFQSFLIIVVAALAIWLSLEIARGLSMTRGEIEEERRRTMRKFHDRHGF